MSESMEISISPSKLSNENFSIVANIRIVDDSCVNKVDVNNDDLATIISEKSVEKSQARLSNDTSTNDCDLLRENDAETRIIENPENIDGKNSNEESVIPDDSSTTMESQRFRYDWNVPPKLLCAAIRDYIPTETNDNFTKGCQWSPDGTCLLVPAEDFRIRIYELPREIYGGKIPAELPLENFEAVLSVREGGLVYDSCWYPLMNSWDPATCCFLSTSRESPLHLWDAFTGELRATYRPYNQVDEVEAAISVQFIDNGREVWCGFKGALRSFDTNRPGRQRDTITLKKDFPNVTGLVSCIRENPTMPGLIAFGTYSKCIGLYKDGPLCSLKADSGVTQIEFSPCGMKLYSAVRRSDDFLCWDLRNPGTVLHSMRNRSSNTNQRIQFGVSSDGSEIISGGTDGSVCVWRPMDNTSEEEDFSPVSRIKLSKDCVNGVSMHKNLPILATSSGQRLCDDQEYNRDNSVRLWFFQAEQQTSR